MNGRSPIKASSNGAQADLFFWALLLLPLAGLLLLVFLWSRKRAAQQKTVSVTNPRPSHQSSIKYFSEPKKLICNATNPASQSNAFVESMINAAMEETSNSADSNLTKPDSLSADANDQKVLSVVQEEISVNKQQVERGRVRVSKRVESREELIDAPIVREQVIVERIPFHRLIEGDVPVERDEDGVLIIPIFEEIAVAATQLMLREEVHISKRLVTKTAQQVVTVRQGMVDIERIALESEPSGVNQLSDQAQTTSLTNQEPFPITTAVKQEEPRASISFGSNDAALTSETSLPEEAAPPVELQASGHDAATIEEVVIPVMAEEVTLTPQQVTRGKVKIRTGSETVEQVISSPVMHEELIIEHIPRNQLIEGEPPQIREENGVQIVPVLEEVLVSRTQLLLREEVRISKRRVTETVPQTVTLRYEVADIEQVGFESFID